MASKANKQSKQSFAISNRTYDVLKVVATIVLPAIDTLYLTLASIWHLGFGAEIDATIQALVAFANVLLGIFVVHSSASYKKAQEKPKKAPSRN